MAELLEGSRQLVAWCERLHREIWVVYSDVTEQVARSQELRWRAERLGRYEVWRRRSLHTQARGSHEDEGR